MWERRQQYFTRYEILLTALKHVGCDVLSSIRLYGISTQKTTLHIKVKKKSKAVPLHAMEAHGGRGGIAPTHT
jgi:hypothetical protein